MGDFGTERFGVAIFHEDLQQHFAGVEQLRRGGDEASVGLLWADSVRRQGIDVVYYGGGSDQGENPAAPTYDTDVVQMRSKGVDMVVNAIDMNGFQKLCQAMDRHDCRALVFSSSATVYGKPERLPIREDAALASTTPVPAAAVACRNSRRFNFESRMRGILPVATPP